MKIDATFDEARLLCAALRGYDEKLVAALAGRQASLDPEYRDGLRADRKRVESALRALGVQP